MKLVRGTLKVLKKDGKTFIYAVTTLSSINSSGEHEETVELFELPDLEVIKAQAKQEGKQEMYYLIGLYFEIENSGEEETKNFKKRHNLK